MADDLVEMLDDAVLNTDREILTDAFADEPVKEAGETEAQPETEAKADNRDPETGKFTAKEAPKTESEPEAKAKGETKDDGAIPSWRLREEADGRREAEKRIAALEAKIAALTPKNETKSESIDPLLDPEGFAKSLKEGLAAELRQVTLNSNLAIAHVRHGEKFEKAYNALLAEGQNGNRQLVNSLVGQPNPGEAIVKWFSNQEVLREVGGDPAAYRAKLLEEALKDPDYLQKAVEAFRGQAGGSQQPKPRVELPPSLSRASGSSKNVDPSDTDNSERAVFDYAFK